MNRKRLLLQSAAVLAIAAMTLVAQPRHADARGMFYAVYGYGGCGICSLEGCPDLGTQGDECAAGCDSGGSQRDCDSGQSQLSCPYGGSLFDCIVLN